VSAGFVDALAAGGDERHACPDDHSEPAFHQVDECLGVELRDAVDLL
jgi:hypothetical protein